MLDGCMIMCGCLVDRLKKGGVKRRSLYPCWIFLLVLVACGGDNGPVVVEDAWGRPSPASAQNSAFYMKIENNTEMALTLIGVETDNCRSAELHETVVDEDSVMSMRPIEPGELIIPAGAALALEPGGRHVMCIGVTGPLAAGDTVPLSLILDGTDEMKVDVEIRGSPP